MEQNKTEFTPSLEMRKWLKAAVDPTVSPFISEIATACGVDRRKWYRWRKKKAFREWWANIWERRMQESEWYLDKIALRMAMKNPKYLEILQKKYTKMRDKVDVTSDGNAIQFGIMTTRIGDEHEEDQSEPKTS